MLKMNKVSVIIPHYNDLHGLDRCLDALAAQAPSGCAHEIVVVDNNSPVGEAAVADRIAGRARLVVCREQGAGPSRNAGVAASDGDVLAFIDSDCVATPRWIAEGVKALQSTDVVGGHVSVLTRDGRSLSLSEAYEAVFAFDFKTYIEKKGFTGSGNMFVRRTDFERVGGFRKAVSEDVDWSHRARAAGLVITYSRNAEVGHPARETWAELIRKFRRVHREMYTLAGDRKGGRVKWLVRTWAMPLSVAAHVPRVLRSPALPDGRTRAKGLIALTAIRLWRFWDGNLLMLGRK